MMTRKDYKAIAAIVQRTLEPERRVQITLSLVDYMKQDNPNFDPDKFVNAIYDKYRSHIPGLTIASVQYCTKCPSTRALSMSGPLDWTTSQCEEPVSNVVHTTHKVCVQCLEDCRNWSTLLKPDDTIHIATRAECQNHHTLSCICRPNYQCVLHKGHTL